MKLPGTYLDGFLLPVPTPKLEEYRQLAQQAAAIWIEHGALHYMETAADDLSTEFCRSFTTAADTKEGETVVFAFAIFADRAARDAANAKIMTDERLKAACPVSNSIFDCKRMAFGGFKAIVNE
ncbi:MAG TPA: DUF1428 domain-containing protein [Verrucomicrobiales bacterium]|nr:DUF1428 domain-containing protein [Verrucomicrobiales bacterium]